MCKQSGCHAAATSTSEAAATDGCDRSREEVLPHELGVFVRSEGELERARAAVAKTGLSSKMLDKHVETTSGQVSIGTMRLAKGLEFPEDHSESFQRARKSSYDLRAESSSPIIFCGLAIYKCESAPIMSGRQVQLLQERGESRVVVQALQ